MDRRRFEDRFGAAPQAWVRSPGRVELLGNHTDYNGGFVLTVAIDRFIEMAGVRTSDEWVTLYSQAFAEEARFSLQAMERGDGPAWADYGKGVLVELTKRGVPLGGLQAMIGGNLPIGAGVSSSAALETATALLVEALYPYTMDRMEQALLCQRAENDFVGMPCGLLDQMSCLFGGRDAVLFLDCLTREHQRLPLPSPVPALVLCDSHTKHALVDGEYRNRREACEKAAAWFGQALGRPVRCLREVSKEEFRIHAGRLEDVPRRRARHVIEENERVQQGVIALERKDLPRLGELMRQSHESSKTLFENSCLELDVLVEEAGRIDGCYGSKLTGGGFGGCTVNLVEAMRVPAFCETIQARFQERTGKPCGVMTCSFAEGAAILNMD